MNKAKSKGLNIAEGFGGYFNEEESVLSKIAKNAKNGSLEYKMPITLGRPQNNSAVIAQDSCALNNVNLFKDEWSSLYPQFIGYSSLSLLQQEPLIRAGVEALVDDMTRKFIKIVGKGDSDLTEKISQIEEDLDYFKVKDIFNKADTLCGYQGGCLVYIDVGPLDDETKKSPLVFDPILFPKNQFRGFKVIEPINVYPGHYNTSDPTSEDYYNPETWYVLGKEYHKSRFLYFTQNEMPLLLKPIYNFFGLSLSQQVLDYVDKFTKNREAMQRLLNKFSLTYIATDMSQVLSPGSGCNNASSFANLKRRGQLLARQRSNDGILFYDKQKEEIGQLNTPLAGVADIVASSLDMLPIIFGESKDKYYGDLPKGLNASSEGTNRIYYDKILSLNEKINSANISRVLELLQVNRGYEIDRNISFNYIPLWEMDEKEKAELNKTIADTDAVYLDRGVLSPAEIRNRLAHDVNNDYNSIDPDDVPDNEFDNITDIDDEDKAGEVFDSSPRQDKIDYVMNEFKEGRLKSSDGKLVTDKGQALAIAYSEAEKLVKDSDIQWFPDGIALDEWDENKHPRKSNGQFGSGSGDRTENIKEINQNIKNIIDEAKSSNTEHKIALVGKVSQKLENDAHKAGYDITGYEHTIDSYGIKHALKKHSNSNTEEARGQIPIIDEDILKIPEITTNYDKVTFGNKDKIGNNLIIYSKTMPDGLTYYVEEIRTGRRHLNTKTMYKLKG